MIRLENTIYNIGGFTLEADISVNTGEYFVILGPNGAGKTVLLETIAGFNECTSGAVLIDGEPIHHLPPEKRPVGIVYQDDALFPHLSVRENVLFGLKVRNVPATEREVVLCWISGITGIGDLLGRKPSTLSGGERRRVALARALSIKPPVLLLDEPLTALDPETREKMTMELKRFHRLLGLTTIHVCHDFSEAVSLGDRIVVMDRGKVRQTGTPEEIFRKPESEFVARFTMARNIFGGTTTPVDGENAIFRSGGMEIRVRTGIAGPSYAVVRPEEIIFSETAPNDPSSNRLKGRVTAILDTGTVIYVTAEVPPAFTVQLGRAEFRTIKPEEGKDIFLVFQPSSVHVFK